MKQASKKVQNFKMEEFTKTSVSNLPAYKIIYSGRYGPPSEPKYDLKWTNMFIIQNNNLWLITHTTEAKSRVWSGIANQMINSFEFY